MSFGNIANAISVVQKNMNITGTTAREASQTISGSIAQMKAAWQNLLTAIGTGNNLDQALNDFVDSVQTVADNIGPAIKEMAPRLTQAFIQVFREIGPIIADVITDVFIGALKSIPQLISQTSSLTKAFIAMGVAIKGIQAAVIFVKMANDVSKFAQNLNSAVNWMRNLNLAEIKETISAGANAVAKIAQAAATGIATVAQMALNAAMAAAPYALVALLIAGLVAGLALLVKHLYEVTDGFTDWSIVSDTMNKINGSIDNVIQKIHQFGKDTGITDAISNASQKINSFFGNINSKVANAISQVGSSIKNGLSSAVVNVGNRLSDMGQSFSYGFGNVVNTVSNAMNNIGQNIRGTASSFGNYVSSGLSSLSATFTNTFNGILSSVGNWGSSMYNSAVNAVQNMISGIKNAFSNIVNEFKNIGANIVNGILSGFTNTWDKFVSKVKSGVEDVKKLFQSMFDIHSPSRWFKWIGEMCVAGFDEGFSDFGNNSLDNVNTKLNSTLGSVQASVSGGQVGLGGYTQIINVNQQISTPDELARAIRNETRMGIMTGAYA